MVHPAGARARRDALRGGAAGRELAPLLQRRAGTARSGSARGAGSRRPTHRWGIATKPCDQLDKDLVGTRRRQPSSSLRGYDDRIDAAVDGERRATPSSPTELSELRLVKDDYEVDRLQEAVDMTIRGFEDVVRALPTAIGRTERVIEGVFNLRARVEGNDVGYSTIAAAGSHATILHWMRNDGEVPRRRPAAA